MDIKLKVCGMRDAANIMEMLDARPDYMGFIFYEKSPRYYGDAPPVATPRIKRVGVFVNQDVASVIETARRHRLDGVQLHGAETPEVCRLARDAGFFVIKAFAVDENTDLSKTKKYEPAADYFLFDTKTSSYGGSGRSFNWKVLESYSNAKPFFLSGGVDLAMADEIAGLKNLNLYAVDINSRFETEPGIKDIEKVRLFKQKLKEIA